MELVVWEQFEDAQLAGRAIESLIDNFYNTIGRYRSIGSLSPAEFETYSMETSQAMEAGEPIEIEIDKLQKQLDCLKSLDDVSTANELAALDQRFPFSKLQPIQPRDLPLIWHQQYRLIRYLGGGMSDVYLAQQINLGDREVVVKIFPTDSGMDQAKLTLFREEGRILAKAGQANVANIVFPIDFAVHDGTPYLVMEYVAGETFNELAARANLRLVDVVKAVTSAARALADAHAIKIVHGDVKPSNLVVKPDGSVKLIDFGLTAFFKESERSRFGGTLPYAAPEQLSGKQVDARTDVYCLGVVLRELVSKTEEVEQAGDAEHTVPIQQLLELADQMTAFSKDQRPESANVVVQRLQQIARPKSSSQNRIVSVATATLMAAVALLSYWFLWPPNVAHQSQVAGLRAGGINSSRNASGQKASRTKAHLLDQPDAQDELSNPQAIDVDLGANTSSGIAIAPGKVIGVSPRRKFIIAREAETDSHQIIDLKGGKVIGDFEAISGGGLNWNSDETVIMVAGHSEQLTYVTILSGTGNVLQRWSTAFVQVAEMSPVGDRILLHGTPLRMTDLKGKSIESFIAPNEQFRGWNNFFGASPWSPDGSKFAFYDEANQNALIYSADGGNPLTAIKIGSNGYTRFGWLRSGTEFTSGNRRFSLNGTTRSIPHSEGNYLAFSPDETQWAASDGTICQSTGRTIRTDQFFDDGFIFWDQPDVITSIDHQQPGRFREFTAQGKLIREVIP